MDYFRLHVTGTKHCEFYKAAKKSEDLKSLEIISYESAKINL